MPPDASPIGAALQTRALWRELAAVYQTLSEQIAVGEWDQAARLAPRLAELETTLRPLMSERRSAVHDPAVVELWSEVDGIVSDLVTRVPALAGSARAA